MPETARALTCDWLLLCSCPQVLGAVGEEKTKPSQHSVQALRAAGLSPDFLVCRSTQPLSKSVKQKLANFCHVPADHCIGVHDLSNIYRVPLLLHSQELTRKVAERLGSDVPVELGMRYGEPSIPSALRRLLDARVQHLVVFPLYPQYSSAANGSSLEVVFREAGDASLVRRFGETRRPHPLAGDGDVASAIRREREALAWLRGEADRIVDTSAYNGHQLRATIRSLFRDEADESKGGLRVELLSFGFKHGLPVDADLVWDARFLPNPFYVEELRAHTGRDREVKDYVLSYPAATEFLALARSYLEFSLPLYEREGKTYLTVAIGCTGGHHRSVVLVEGLGESLREGPLDITIRHRDIER